jgi:hypothetical protein
MRPLRSLLGALALSLTAASAHATAGQEDGLGRAAASDVVVLDVLKVRPLDGGDVATCRVFGRTIRAERGVRFKPRQSVRLIVPCALEGSGASDAKPKWVDREALLRSAHGRAFMASDGALIAYELYDLN